MKVLESTFMPKSDIHQLGTHRFPIDLYLYKHRKAKKYMQSELNK